MTLIGHWKATNVSGSTVTDLSGGGLDGTFVGSPSVITLDNGETAIRCGASDGIEVSDDAKWNLTDFTMIVRFQRNDYNAPGPLIVHKPLAGGLVDSWSFMHLSGVLVASIPSLVLRGRSGPAYQILSNPFNPVYNQPVTAWIKRSGSDVTFGVNDATIGTQTFATALPEVAEPLRFGSCDGETSFRGDLSFISVRIYDAALSYADIQTAYLADAKAPLADPAANTQIARWRPLSNEGSGTVFPTRLGSAGIDGVVGSFCQWVTEEGCPAVFCDTGSIATPLPSPQMTNRTECITVEHDKRWRLNPGGDFTIIARASFTDSAHDNGIVGHSESAGANVPMWAFYLSPSLSGAATRLAFTWVTDGSVERKFATSSSFSQTFPTATGGWAVSKSSTTYSFFTANASPVGTTIATGSLASDIVAPLFIGRAGNQTWDGGEPTMVSIRFYNYALATSVIADAMTADAACAVRRHRNGAWVDQIMVTA